MHVVTKHRSEGYFPEVNNVKIVIWNQRISSIQFEQTNPQNRKYDTGNKFNSKIISARALNQLNVDS